MFKSLESQRAVGRFAWAMAWVGLVMGQLHALARHNTADGKEDLELPLTRAWSDPARELLSPLLGWADPDAVYLTYGKLWLPVFVAFTACAFVVYRRRRPRGFEKWAWRVALFGYCYATVAVGAEYWTQLADYNAIFEPVFLLSVPGILISLLSSTVLGITLLVKRAGMPVTGWLLAVIIPFGLAISMVTSLGSVALPMMFAFGVAGRRIAREPAAPRDPQSLVLNAASNAASGASNASRRTNSSASGAPTSRSIPASSHSTEMGPV